MASFGNLFFESLRNLTQSPHNFRAISAQFSSAPTELREPAATSCTPENLLRKQKKQTPGEIPAESAYLLSFRPCRPSVCRGAGAVHCRIDIAFAVNVETYAHLRNESRGGREVFNHHVGYRCGIEFGHYIALGIEHQATV